MVTTWIQISYPSSKRWNPQEPSPRPHPIPISPPIKTPCLQNHQRQNTNTMVFRSVVSRGTNSTYEHKRTGTRAGSGAGGAPWKKRGSVGDCREHMEQPGGQMLQWRLEAQAHGAGAGGAWENSTVEVWRLQAEEARRQMLRLPWWMLWNSGPNSCQESQQPWCHLRPETHLTFCLTTFREREVISGLRGWPSPVSG